MKNLSMVCFMCVFFVVLYGCIAQQTKGTAFYVALSGNDDNPGTETKPFATLDRARDAIREYKAALILDPGNSKIRDNLSIAYSIKNAINSADKELKAGKIVD